MALETWATGHYHKVWKERGAGTYLLLQKSQCKRKSFPYKSAYFVSFWKLNTKYAVTFFIFIFLFTSELDDFRRVQFRTKNFKPLWCIVSRKLFFFHFRQQCAITFFLRWHWLVQAFANFASLLLMAFTWSCLFYKHKRSIFLGCSWRCTRQRKELWSEMKNVLRKIWMLKRFKIWMWKKF